MNLDPTPQATQTERFVGTVVDLSSGYVRVIDRTNRRALSFVSRNRSMTIDVGDVLTFELKIYWGSLSETAAHLFNVPTSDVGEWNHAIVYGGLLEDRTVKCKSVPPPAALVPPPAPIPPFNAAVKRPATAAIMAAVVNTSWKCASDGKTIKILSVYEDKDGFLRCKVSNPERIRKCTDFALSTVISDYVEVP